MFPLWTFAYGEGYVAAWLSSLAAQPCQDMSTPGWNSTVHSLSQIVRTLPSNIFHLFSVLLPEVMHYLIFPFYTYTVEEVLEVPTSKQWFSFSLNQTSLRERWGTLICKSIIIDTRPVIVQETPDTPRICVTWPMSKLFTNFSTLSAEKLSLGNLKSNLRHLMLRGSQTSLSTLKNELCVLQTRLDFLLDK